jgi:hypothetical protein
MPHSPAPRPAAALARELVGVVVYDGIVADLAGLERRLFGLREGAMRRAVCAEWLLRLEPAPLVAGLLLLLERSRDGNGAAQLVLQQLAVEPVAYARLDPAQASAAAALAEAVGAPEVGRLVRGALVELDRAAEARDNQHLDLPLGVRRAAARAHDRFRLDRLLHDRDWRVIGVLLDNPRIIERDVVRIAALRPTTAEVLQVVARHPRWSSRPAVRKALCCNPHTPLVIARRLLPTLLVQDLRHVMESGALVSALAPEARALLRMRSDGQMHAPGALLGEAPTEEELASALAAASEGAPIEPAAPAPPPAGVEELDLP